MTNKRRENYRYINRDEEACFKFFEDMECVERNPLNLLRQYKIERRERYKVSKKYLTQQLGPKWYQELSKLHMETANEFFDALKEFDPTTVSLKLRPRMEMLHNRQRVQMVKKLLKTLGLKPLPNRKQLAYAVKFSRANDLALLWFLYEMVYSQDDNHEKPRKYSINERIILSCICHLDMMTTLRELDSILPKRSDYIKPAPPNKDLPRKRLPANQPWRKHPIPKYKPYLDYRDPEFVIQNETNRWFADGNLRRTSEEKIIDRVMKETLDDALQIKEEDTAAVSLCTKHKEDLEEEKRNKVWDKIKKFDKFQEGNYNRDDPDDQKREGIIYGFERDIERTHKEMTEAEKNFQAQILVRKLLRQVLEGSLDRNHLTRCSKCLEFIKRVGTDGSMRSSTESEQSKSKTKIKKNSNNDSHFHDLKSFKSVHDFKYFTSSPEHCLYEFDYDKIFANTSKTTDPVKDCISKILNPDKYQSDDIAITACLEAMWKRELGLWEDKDRLSKILNQNYVIINDAEDFNSPKKCLQLLKRGIKILRSNPKFLLASLPDAEKLPILKEWVLNRYGFRKTIAEDEYTQFVHNYHLNNVILSGGAMLKKISRKNPHLKNFGVPKPKKTIDQFLKLSPFAMSVCRFGAGFPPFSTGFLMSDSNCRFFTPQYEYRPYSRL